MSKSSVHNHDDENTSNVGHTTRKKLNHRIQFFKYPKRLMRELNYKDSVFNVKMMGLHQL